MRDFEYYRPSTLVEALELLGNLGEEARPVAGATDMWVNLHAGKSHPEALVSVRGLGDLVGLRWDVTQLVVGAATPHAAIEDSPEVSREYPALQQACSSVGSRQVRNVGTVGGNLCNAAPSADSAVPLLIYDAVCVAQSREGTREIPVAEFFTGPGQTVLRRGELLREVRLPRRHQKTFSGYWKLTRRKAVELPVLGVGVCVRVADDGETVAEARIGLGVAGPTPIRALHAEKVLQGKRLTRETVAEAAEVAAGEAKVRDSWRGKAWYRRQMIRVLIPRVLERAGGIPA